MSTRIGRVVSGVLVVIALIAVGAGPAGAQDRFPGREIRIIMPTPPGGGTDILGRSLVEQVKALTGWTLIVENKPEAGGVAGITLVSQARPDGYTLGFIWNGAVTALPHSRVLPYTLDSMTPILQIGASSYVMCAHPAFPAGNAKEMIQYLKANPGKYTYGNDGVGNTMQLAAERIFGHFDVKLRPVPFGGAGETLRAFLGEHVDFYGGSLPPILPHVQAGKAKCLLLTSAADNPAMPSASGLAALGIPEEETVLWWGLVGPPGLPPDRLAAIEEAFRKGTDTPAYRARLAKVGAAHTIRGPAEFARLIRAEYAALGQVVKRLGLERKAQ